jgi:hypothetical protein
MSKIALSGNSLGSGTLTISAPNTNVDRVLDLPDAAGDFVLNTATQTLTNKTLTSPTLTTPNIDSAQVATVSGTAPIYMCRAWVNFDGTTSPGTIRASGNVSSVTRNATGDYTINFTTAMPDANYSTNVTNGSDTTGNSSWAGANVLALMTAPSTSAVRVGAWFAFNGGNRTSNNAAYVFVSIFR